jgi:predicted transcriptional regulator
MDNLLTSGLIMGILLKRGIPQEERKVGMKEKDSYTLQELFDDLPITIARLARESEINEVTLARIRNGERTRRDTANKLLRTMSKVYGLDLNTRNVTGINVMVNLRLERRESRGQQFSSGESDTRPLVAV